MTQTPIEVIQGGPIVVDVYSGSPAGNMAMEHPSAGGDAQLVSGNKTRFRKDFIHATNAAFLEDFDVVIGTGQTATSGTGNLIMTSGTTINQTSTVTTKQMFTVPFTSAFGFKVSAKSTNVAFYVELVACDPITGVIDETVVAAWKVAGSDAATTTLAQYEVRNGGAARLASSNVTVPTVTTDFIFEISLENDEVWFHAKAMDSTTGRTTSFARQSVCPNPSKTYKLRYRMVNAGTAPVNTTFTSAFIAAQDSTDIKVEVTGGQGSSSAGQAIPVAITGAPTVTVGATVLGASATANGTSVTKVLSAASTNATLIKSTAGRIYGYQLANTTAAWKFVKFYNAGGAPVPGTTVPLYQVALPPNTTVDANWTVPIAHTSGIGIAITNLAADLDATAVAAGDVVGSILWL